MINLRDLLGIPFTNRGRTLDGLDCYGLVMEVYKKFDITLPEYNADFDDTEKTSCGNALISQKLHVLWL
jgi:cell wall-associated NlpC family hydrolase